MKEKHFSPIIFLMSEFCRFKKWSMILLVVLFLFGLSFRSANAAQCGNGICEVGETVTSCSADCGTYTCALLGGEWGTHGFQKCTFASGSSSEWPILTRYNTSGGQYDPYGYNADPHQPFPWSDASSVNVDFNEYAFEITSDYAPTQADVKRIIGFIESLGYKVDIYNDASRVITDGSNPRVQLVNNFRTGSGTANVGNTRNGLFMFVFPPNFSKNNNLPVLVNNLGTGDTPTDFLYKSATSPGLFLRLVTLSKESGRTGIIGVIAMSGGQGSQGHDDESLDAFADAITFLKDNFNADNNKLVMTGGSRGGGISLIRAANPRSHNYTAIAVFAGTPPTALGSQSLVESTNLPSMDSYYPTQVGWAYYPNYTGAKNAWQYNSQYPPQTGPCNLCKSLVGTTNVNEADMKSAIGYADQQHFGGKYLVIGYGTHDFVIPYHLSIKFDEALRDAGVPHKICIVLKGGHGEVYKCINEELIKYVFDYVTKGITPSSPNGRYYYVSSITDHVGDNASYLGSENEGIGLPFTANIPSQLDSKIDYAGYQNDYIDKQQPAAIILTGAKGKSFKVQLLDSSHNFLQEWSGEFGTGTTGDESQVIKDIQFGCSDTCIYYWKFWFDNKEISSYNTPFVSAGNPKEAYTKVITSQPFVTTLEQEMGGDSSLKLSMGITSLPSCGNHTCEAWEKISTCPEDCGSPSDTTPPVISSVSASSITLSSATITWTTNEASDSQVEYGLSTSYGSQTVLNTSSVTSHSQNLSGLTANTTYHYRVKSKDAAGNLAISIDYTFTTSAPSDATPPLRSSGSPSGTLAAGTTTTILSLATNENATCRYATVAIVDYSTMTNNFYPLTVGTNHWFTLTNLANGATYNYYVRCLDSAGNANPDDYQISFSVALPADTTSPAAIVNLATSDISQTSLNLTWTASGDDGNTGTASSYDIRYSTAQLNESSWVLATQISGEPTPQAAGISQSMIIVGLLPSTTYYFALKTADEVPNWSGLSNVVSATTPGNTCTSFTYSAWGACQPDNAQSRTTTSSSPLGCTGGNPILTKSCTYTPPTCTSFTYSAWGTCQPDNAQRRTIVSQSPTGCSGGNPILSQSCTYVSTPPFCTSFTYSAWGACQPDNAQSRTTTSSSPLGCTGGNPILTQSCTYTPPTCTSFTYSAWGACQPDNAQRRTVLTHSPLGCTGGTPKLSQSCTYTPPSSGGGSGSYSDIIPPAQPKSFQASSQDRQIILNWINPTDSDFVRVLIARKEGSAPTSSTDGKMVYEGNLQEYRDANLDANKKYYYAIYAYDKKPNYSQPVIISAQTKSLSEYPLVKTSGSSDIYVIKDNKRELIPNWQSFLSFGYQLANLKIISQEEMAKYEAVDLSKIDSDNDKLTNAQERQLGTNAAKADTDGDGYNDYEEISTGHDPLKPAAGKIFAYGKPRLSSLAAEQGRARTLRSELEKKYTKEQLKGLSAKNWSTVVNSYVYGSYPIEAIVKALKFSGKTVHPTIPWSVWQKSKDYSDYINR